ncbi:MAG: hypothetical protein DRQ62_14125 [Gammaproteobacteria bacterium]|nr:MAG: hypothetical protein DRQ62_14125 [Gammaproteobacteria bacterium]
MTESKSHKATILGFVLVVMGLISFTYFGRLTYLTAATSVFLVAVFIPQSVLYYVSFRLSLGSFGTMENLTPWYMFVVPPALAVITLWVCRLITIKFNGQVS